MACNEAIKHCDRGTKLPSRPSGPRPSSQLALESAFQESPSRPTHDLFAMSREEGIPPEADGCLLSFIDGYVVSGHVPVGTVNKLLTERPDIKGHDAARHADGLPRHEWHEGSALRDSRNPKV
ncbi:hypothetical protein A4R28_22215 [Mesorhizobium ciceri]|uniref:DUF411 domain-containing protein n=2 Tax=Mesorhizobium TaxID=68287 RepID=UPI0007A95084|nr:hypothetical protein A4R28_22215 [Mesorhizobium ciceri]